MKINFKREHWLLFVIFVGVHLLYFRTATAGFVTDFSGLSAKFERGEFWDFLNCFGFPAMHQIRNLVLWCLYQTFGIHGYGWYAVFSTLHIVNAWLVFRLGTEIFAHFKIEKGKIAAGVAALFFAFCPYHTEPMTWRVNFVFLFVTTLFLMLLRVYLRDAERPQRKFFWQMQGLFALALFTFELAPAIPLVLSAFIFFENVYRVSFREFLRKYVRLIAPQAAIIGVYFVLQKMLLNAWVGHYGAETHLNSDPTLIFGNLLKYTSKYLLFSRSFKIFNNTDFYGTLDLPWVWGGALLLVALGFVFTLLRRQKITDNQRVGWLLAAGYFFALLPILNIFFYHTLHIENDRYGYLASVFFFLFAVFLLTKIPKYFALLIVLIYLPLSIYLTGENTERWAAGDAVYRKLLETFRWQDAENVYILTLPDNMEGAGMFRRYQREHSTLRDALENMYHKKLKGNLHEITHFNQQRISTGFAVNQDSTGFIRLKWNEYGSWFWDCGHGADDYETPDYIFKTTEWGNGKFLIKNQGEKDVIIFADGDKWSEVKTQD